MNVEMVETPWRVSFFVGNTNSRPGGPISPRIELLQSLDDIAPRQWSPKTGDKVPDDWPQLRDGPDIYANCSSGIDAPRASGNPPPPPPEPSLKPISPSAYVFNTYSGILSPVFFWNPYQPMPLNPFSPAEGVSPSLIGGSVESCATPQAPNIDPIPSEAVPTKAVSTEHAGPAAEAPKVRPLPIEASTAPIIELSMPPKCIARRVAASEPVASEPAASSAECENVFSSSPRIMAVKKVSARQARNDQDKGVKKGGAARSKVSQIASANAIESGSKGYCPTDSRTSYNHRYKHLWGTQSDRLDRDLERIGFKVLVQGPRNYVCSLCGDSFINRMFIQRHAIKAHLDDKGYVCNVCGIKCSRNDTLIRHVRHKHGEHYL